jgi:tetratricopeptide (TPR) repeat protein
MRLRERKTLPPEVENAIDAIAGSINAGQTIIFCGAGISRDSGFPVVNEFVPYMLLTLCAGSEEIPAIEAGLKAIADAEQRQNRLKQIIAEKMEVSPEVIDKIVNNLPFEAFVEALHENSKIDEILGIYDAEAYEPHVEPNTNHMLLARLVATGKVRTIVTTNFDQLIEKALEQQGKKANRDYDVIYREEDFERIDWRQDRCRLIKLHGSIDDKEAMAITLRQVAKQELSASRAAVIRQVFSLGDHKEVLILGYSCSDVFDLSPQIERLGGNLKQVYLVEHVGGPKIEDIRDRKENNPFKASVNSTRVFLHTGDMVETLWNATLEEPYQDHETPENPPDWKAKVHTWYTDSVRTHSEAIKDLIPGRLFYAICEWRAATGRYERVLAYARGHGDARLEGLALGNMGIAYKNLGEHRKAVEFQEQHLEIALRIGDVRGEGSALSNAGNAYSALGEHRRAIGLYQQHLEIALRIGDVEGTVCALGNLGSAYADVGEYHKAIEVDKLALKTARSIGDVQGEGNALGNMGIAYKNLGEHRKAIEFQEQHLEIARRIGDVQGEGSALGNMGMAYADLGDYRTAIGLYEQHLEIARRIGEARSEGMALGNMGMAYADLGDYRTAIGLYEQHLEIARRIGEARSEGNALGNMGNAYEALGEHRKAVEFQEQHLEIARRIGDVRGEGSALSNAGNAYSALGEHRRAIGLYEQALVILRRIGDVQAEGSALCNTGIAYTLVGDRKRAKQAFAQSRAIFARLELPHLVNRVDEIMKEVGL